MESSTWPVTVNIWSCPVLPVISHVKHIGVFMKSIHSVVFEVKVGLEKVTISMLLVFPYTLHCLGNAQIRTRGW